ncbi:ArnT family glycosyltransferase [Candidatus Leptofilum sp.]|uniref:ArnT family glycosyltransferase n=1 Tax=Candidatus Leptofilum sp. TaxID=3241576 RepID=UPI003B5B751A
MNRNRQPVLLLLILLLAAFLRLWQLDSFPPGLYHDEAYNGLDALSLVQGKLFPQFYEGWELYAQEAHGDNRPEPTRWPIFFEGNYGREPLHVYLMAVSIWLFGATPFALRLVPALAGVLAVMLTYFAARELLQQPSGTVAQDALKLATVPKNGNQSPISNLQSHIPLLAAFFMAILMPAIHFSRFGLRAMVFVPVEMLTIIFFWRAYNLSQITPSPRHHVTLSFLLAGFFLGLGIYIYAAARLFPLLFVLFVPFWAWQDWSGLRRNVWNVGGMTAVSLLTALPILLFFWRYPYFFVFRIAYVANRGRGTVADQPLLTWLLNVGRVVRGLYWQGETHFRHNLPGRPYLDPIQAIFFTLGVVHTVRQKLNPRTVFLLLWLLVMLLPTIMSGDAPHFGRMTGAAGPIAILVSVGAVWLFSVINQSLVRYRLLFTVYCLLFAVSLAFTVRDYFGRYASHPQLATDFYLPDWELGQLAAAQGERTAVYLTPTQEEMATIFFALAEPDDIRSFSGTGELLPLGFTGEPVVYLVRPSTPETMDRLQTAFPAGEAGEPLTDVTPFFVPAEAARLNGFQTREAFWGEKIALTGYRAEVKENQVRVTLAWQALAEMTREYTAFVHLLDAEGNLVAQLDRPPEGYPTTVWQLGELVQDTYTIQLPADLPPGRYMVQTGFYHLPTLANLGEAAVLTTIQLPR